MLNFYYLYGIIWTFIIVLYSFSWSDFNKNLDPNMLIFLIATIIFSFFMGYIRKNKFKYIPSKKRNHKHTITIILVICFILDFLYSKQIPFISIILGQSEYMDFQGIPILHVFIIAAGAVNCFSLFYKYLGLHEKKVKIKVLIDFVLMLIMYLFLFSRQMLAVVIFGCLVMIYSDLKYHNKMSLTKKRIMILVLLIFMFLYLFGVLGNLRSGYSWNDCSWIEKIGKFNDSYPSFLPKEFMWLYLYITNPLANLSHTLITNVTTSRSVLYSLIPDFIAKRIGGGIFDFWSTGDRFNLVADYLNATTGFSDSVLSARYIGIFIYFFTLVIYSECVIHINRKSSHTVVSMIVVDVVVVFSFFFNTLSYSGIALQLIIVACLGFMKNKKFVLK